MKKYIDVIDQGRFHGWIYLLFFAFLFIQFPLSGSLPGRLDTFYVLGMCYSYKNLLVDLFTQSGFGTFMYPVDYGFLYGASMVGFAPLFLSLKLFISSDIWLVYVIMALTFSANAWIFGKIAAFYLKTRHALAAGLLFASSNFMFSEFDSPETLFMLPALASIYLFRKYLESKQRRQLWWAAAIGGLTAYFSGYNFVFQSAVLVILAASNLKKWKVRDVPVLAGAGLLQLMVIGFFIWLYLFNSRMLTAYNPVEGLDSIKGMSLHFQDIFRYVKHNLLYSTDCGDMTYALCKNRTVGAGFIIWILALIGVFVRFKWKTELLILFFLGLLLAIGPVIQIGVSTYRTPFYFLYDRLGLDGFLRTPVRAIWVAYFSVFLLAANGLRTLSGKYGWRAVAFVCVLFLLENVPAGFQKFDSSDFINSPAMDKRTGNAADLVVLNLPSSLLSDRKQMTMVPLRSDGSIEDEFYRELIYVYWQAKYNYNILNGFSSYFPQSRLQNQELIDSIWETGNLAELIGRNNIDEIHFYKELCFFKGDRQLLDQLKDRPEIYLEHEDHLVAIFKPRKLISTHSLHL